MDNVEHAVEPEVVAPEAPPEDSGQEAPAISAEEQELLDSQAVEEAAAEEASAAAEDAERRSTEKKPWFQKRIDEMARGRGDAERRADRAEALLEQQLLNQQQQQPPPQGQQQAPQFTRPMPTEESCGYDTEKFVDELTDWKLEQRDAQSNVRNRHTQQQQQQQAYQQAFAEKRQETETAGTAKFEDYNEVVGSMPPNVLHNLMADRIFRTESPAEVAYYLGKNPDVAAKISRLNPEDMTIALVRLEGKAVIPPKEPQVSAAPEPIKPVGKKSKAGAEPDPKTDPDGWLKWERARCKKLGKRY